jgi:hypothetical protein
LTTVPDVAAVALSRYDAEQADVSEEADPEAEEDERVAEALKDRLPQGHLDTGVGTRAGLQRNIGGHRRSRNQTNPALSSEK